MPEEVPRTFRVLGISASPRHEATEFIVQYALSWLEANAPVPVETHYFSVSGKKIQFCTHCDYCMREKKGCVFKDNLLNLYPLMESADGWILGTPVYQSNLSGQLKTILDRTRALLARNPRVFENKLGVGIAVAGDRAGGQEVALQGIHAFFISNFFIPVGGGAFGANLGASIWAHDGGAKGAEQDKEGQRVLRKVLKRFLALYGGLGGLGGI